MENCIALKYKEPAIFFLEKKDQTMQVFLNVNKSKTLFLRKQ